MNEQFVVAIKPSARRTNGAVGKLVHRKGPRHTFVDRETAEQWAAGLSRTGAATVWIRSANPNDPADIDAYLVGRSRPVSSRHSRGSGEQSTIPPEWTQDGPRVPQTDRESDTKNTE